MYISQSLTQIKEKLTALKDKSKPEEYDFFESLFGIVEKMASELDLINAKTEENAEKTDMINTNIEHMNANLQEIRNCIVGDVKVDTDSYTKDFDDCCEGNDCDCGHHHNHNANEDKDDEDIYYDEGDEEFVTLQCNFCEELFFIDVKESGTTVECPFCKKQVIVADTIIE